MTSKEAYIEALYTSANIEKCQEVACKEPEYAYCFARDIFGANIEKCLIACKNTVWYYKLLKDLPRIIIAKKNKNVSQRSI